MPILVFPNQYKIILVFAHIYLYFGAYVTFYSHTLSVNLFSFLKMEFWNIANASIHQAWQCLELDHTYPDEIDLHIARLQQILTPLTTFQQAHGAIAERDPNVIQ